MPRNLWTHDELVLTLALYFQLPFGRLNHTTPEVRELGQLVGRTIHSAATSGKISTNQNAKPSRRTHTAFCSPVLARAWSSLSPKAIPKTQPATRHTTTRRISI